MACVVFCAVPVFQVATGAVLTDTNRLCTVRALVDGEPAVPTEAQVVPDD